MSSIFNEKIAIGYFCAGESYRESAKKQLENNYFDDSNIYYLIITDNKEYFNNTKRKNLIVNELKDFYKEFPEIEKYEKLIDSTDKSDYAKKFVENNYRFSFSLMRFHLYQAYKLGISNVSLTCTDTNIDFNVFNNNMLNSKNHMFNAISEWDKDISENNMRYVVSRLKEKYNLYPDQIVRVLDAAARFFIFESVEYMKEFFNVWNDIIIYLFENNLMHHYKGSYVYNDEYILAPLYNVFNLNKKYLHSIPKIYDVNHNQIQERFWSLGSSGEGLKEHTDYNEFLKINNLQNG
jgi:hypothetical protein